MLGNAEQEYRSLGKPLKEASGSANWTKVLGALKAGQKAAQHAANLEAIGHLTTGLHILLELPDSESRARSDEASLSEPQVLELTQVLERLEQALDKPVISSFSKV